MKILLVEDDKGIARMIRRGLEEAGYSVEAAADGLLGMKMTRESNYNLLILDVMLPGMDGWKICEAVRARGDQSPVLMLTARGIRWKIGCADWI